MQKFLPPTTQFQYPTGSRLLDRMKPARGVTVYSLDGGTTWQTAVFPFQGNIGLIDGQGAPNSFVEGTDYFLGGHTYYVTDAVAAKLNAAGYTTTPVSYLDTYGASYN